MDYRSAYTPDFLAHLKKYEGELMSRRRQQKQDAFDVRHARAYAKRNEARDTERIRRFARGRLWISTTLVLETALGFPASKIDVNDKRRIKRLIVTGLGWINTERTIVYRGRKHTVYVPPIVSVLLKALPRRVSLS